MAAGCPDRREVRTKMRQVFVVNRSTQMNLSAFMAGLAKQFPEPVVENWGNLINKKMFEVFHEEGAIRFNAAAFQVSLVQ
jgi:hypothetical protein